MITIIFLYILGYILNYYWMKLLTKRFIKEPWTYEEVSFALKISFGSFLSLIVMTVVATVYKFEKVSKIREESPPWWM